jgi:hypothetical protein
LGITIRPDAGDLSAMIDLIHIVKRQVVATVAPRRAGEWSEVEAVPQSAIWRFIVH